MSSAGNKYITNEEAVPVIDSDIFLGHEDKRFALGVFSADDILSYKPDTVEQAYLKLRSNVYIDQTKFLDNNIRRVDGTELNKDDERSTHFVIVENLIGRVAVFACMRLIQKNNMDPCSALPIEDLFPDAFVSPAPKNSVEVSRFIVRHDESRNCRVAKREIMAAGLSHTFSNDLGPIYGIIELGFERDLSMMKVPTRRVADPRLLSEYNSENIGIEVDKHGFKDRIGEDTINRMNIPVGSFGYWGHMSKDDKNLD